MYITIKYIAKWSNKRFNEPITSLVRWSGHRDCGDQRRFYIWQGHFTISISRGQICVLEVFKARTCFDIANSRMSSLENCYRGALAATPDPATFYRRKFLCASPAGGGKGKRHPGKAILAGMVLLFTTVISLVCQL